MAIDDIVDLMLMLRRRDGEEIEQQAGEEGVSVVQQMDGMIRERMVGENDLYVGLWREFDTDAPTNRAEMVGALEAMVEGDAELADYLTELFADYNQLTLQSGAAWRPPNAEDGQRLVGGLADDAAISEGEHSPVTRVGAVMEGLPTTDEADKDEDDLPDDAAIPTRDDVVALNELDDMAAGEEVADLALLDVDDPTADLTGDALGLLAVIDGMRDEDARADDMGVEDWADMQEEAGMLAEDSAATLPGGPLGRVPVENEMEGIGGDTYVHGRFLPDEDIEEESRPGTLYDTGSDSDGASGGATGTDYNQGLRGVVITVGDVQDALSPIHAAVDDDPDFDRDMRGRLHESLHVIENELLRAGAADIDHLRGELAAIRDAARDLWDMLAWELADLLPDLDPAIQVMLKAMGGPFDAGKK